MNFLAHLHIADHCQSNLLGNLLGDFVKGAPEPHYPEAIAKGVRLHRFVDSYTDQHSEVKSVKTLFDNGTRRYAPIALDMFWDHCLAAHFSEYHPQSLSSFSRAAHRRVAKDMQLSLPPRFVQVHSAMQQGRWLESYQHLDNIGYALERMSQRSPRMAPLVDCFAYLERHQSSLTEVFSRLYPQVLNASKSFC
ncbi:MAG: ACP phosphodiesterase [Pseudomonadota bacterium]